MNKLLSFIIFVFIAISHLQAQKIEIGGGLNINHFYNIVNEGDHYSYKYDPGGGYSIYASIGDTVFSKKPTIMVTYDNYSGTINALDHMLGGISSTKADITKMTIGLIVYPLNFRIFKVGWMNIGTSFNYTVKQKIFGTHYWSTYQIGGGTDTLENNMNHYTKFFTAGLSARLAYEIKINETWFVVPQYLIFVGIIKEVRNIEANPKSFRQTMAIGISKKLTKK
jgi:hypothetical protein